MKFLKGIVAISSLMAAGQLMAQDAAAPAPEVKTEKKALIQSFLPDSYASVEFRHSTWRKMEGDKVTNDVPQLHARPTIGTTLFDGKVDTSFTWIFRKTAESAKVTKIYLFNETQWKVVEGKYGFVGPYAFSGQGNGFGFSSSSVGVYGEGKLDYTTPVGAVDLLVYANPLADLMSAKVSGANKVEPRNETGREVTALAASDNKIEQRHSTIWNFGGFSAKLKPSALPGFAVNTGFDVIQKWEPKYSLKDAGGGDDRVNLAGYDAIMTTGTKVGVSYKISDSVSIANSVRLYTIGLWDQGINTSRQEQTGYFRDSRWENRLTLSATLF